MRPNMYIAYDRVALYGKEDRSLRVTFDQRIRNRRRGLTLDGEEPENLYFEHGEVVMEIKWQCISAVALQDAWGTKNLSHILFQIRSIL